MSDNKKKKLILGISVLFSFFFFGLGFRMNYQPDIYGRVSATSAELARQINVDGRFINMFILFLLHRFSFAFFYYISLILGSLIITYATYRFSLFLLDEFYKVYNREYTAGSIILVSILSCVTVANMFSVEYFLYIDMTVAFNLCILCCVLGAIKYVTGMTKEGFRLYPSVFICMLVVAFSYEPIASLFIILTVPFIVFYSSSFKDFLKNQVIAGLYYGIPLILKTGYTKIGIKSERANFDKISFTESVQVYMPEGSSPKVFLLDRITIGMWAYAALSLVMIVFLMYYVIKKGHKIEIAKGMYIAMVIAIAGLLPFIMRLTNDYKPRIYYPVGAFFGMICIYGSLIGAFDPKGFFKEINGWILGGAIVVLTAVQWISFAQMYADCYVTNYEDKYISEMIGACIDRYEKETGNKVDSLVFYEDAIKTKYSLTGWCLTQRVYSAWYETEALNMYLGRDFGPGCPDAELAEYFHENNWDCFSDELVVLKGNTAHICKY